MGTVRTTARVAQGHVPGEAGAWIIIFGEMIGFVVLFLTYLYYRALQPQVFEESQRTLEHSHGVLLTLVLLTSSLLVMLAVRAVRHGLPDLAQRLVLASLACGAAFSALKYFEYHDKVAHDLTPQTNDFYMLYFVLTGIHLFHVLLGLGDLAFLWRTVGKPELSARQLAFVEIGACYWHMVDLLWLVLFPLLYLVR